MFLKRHLMTEGAVLYFNIQLAGDRDVLCLEGRRVELLSAHFWNQKNPR